MGGLKAAAKAAGLPEIAICPEQASLMQILLKLNRASEVVEVGTLGGYSAISMARALPDGGQVRTVELDEHHADFARSWVAKSDVPAKVVVHQGSGLDVLPTFETDSADACFLDADKINYPRYLDECLRIVRTGGLIMADNALAFGHLLDESNTHSSVVAIRNFNERVASEERLHPVLVPLGDGMWAAIKLR